MLTTELVTSYLSVLQDVPEYGFRGGKVIPKRPTESFLFLGIGFCRDIHNKVRTSFFKPPLTPPLKKEGRGYSDGEKNYIIGVRLITP